MVTQFQVGRVYSSRSLCDYECIFKFAVVERTAKTVTILVHARPARRKIRVVDDVECIDPLGRYSMSPVLRASS